MADPRSESPESPLCPQTHIRTSARRMCQARSSSWERRRARHVLTWRALVRQPWGRLSLERSEGCPLPAWDYKFQRLQGLLLGARILPPLTSARKPTICSSFLDLNKGQTTPVPTDAGQALNEQRGSGAWWGLWRAGFTAMQESGPTAVGKWEAWIVMEIDGQGILVVSNPVRGQMTLCLWIRFGPRAPVCGLCLRAEAGGWERAVCLGNSWDSLRPVSPWPGLAGTPRVESWDSPGDSQAWTAGEAPSRLHKSSFPPPPHPSPGVCQDLNG